MHLIRPDLLPHFHFFLWFIFLFELLKAIIELNDLLLWFISIKENSLKFCKKFLSRCLRSSFALILTPYKIIFIIKKIVWLFLRLSISLECLTFFHIVMALLYSVFRNTGNIHWISIGQLFWLRLFLDRHFYDVTYYLRHTHSPWIILL